MSRDPRGRKRADPAYRARMYGDTVFGRWFAASEHTLQSLAEVLGYSHQNISSILHGKSMPSPALMLRIEQATQGAVTMQSWFEHGLGDVDASDAVDRDAAKRSFDD